MSDSVLVKIDDSFDDIFEFGGSFFLGEGFLHFELRKESPFLHVF